MNARILKWTTILAIASSVIMAALGIVSQFYAPVQPRLELYVSVLLLAIAALMTY